MTVAITTNVDGVSTVTPATPKVEETKLSEIAPVVPVAEEEVIEEARPKKGKIAERISELSARARAAEERASAAERERDALKAKTEPKPEPDGKPKPKDYTDTDKYIEDLAEWKVNARLAARDKEAAEKAQKDAQEKAVKEWQKRVGEVKKELPDYADVLASADDLSVSDEVRDAIIESEVGPRVLYHLAQNPDLVEALNEMSKSAALRTIGKLESKFEKAPEAEKPKMKAVKVAPEPITPVKNTPGPEARVDGNGNYLGTFAQYEADRAAHRI